MSQTVMIVEDNPVTRKLVRFALEHQGFQVITASTASAALESFATHPVTLVLQDLMLPDLDGHELIGRLRALPGGSDVPILAFSGLLSSSDQARYAAAGFDDIIVKPIEPSRLLQIVRSHLPLDVPRSPMVGRRRVVLADDDAVQRKLAAYRLQKAGFDVITAADGNAALSKVRETKPDVVLSDVLMPGLDGFGLCVAIRNDPTITSIPVLLITNSYLEPADRELARRAGAHDLLLRTPELHDVIQLLSTMRSSSPTSLPVPVDSEIDQVRAQRVLKQLERQLALNNTANQRATLLAAELAVLRAISEAMTTHHDAEPALRHALAACFDAGGISTGALYLFKDDAPHELRVMGLGFGDGSTEGLEDFFGHNHLVQSAIATQSHLRVPSIAIPSDISAQVLERAHAGSLLGIPLSHQGSSFGLLLMGSPTTDLLNEDRVMFAEAVGGQISIALALARAFAEKDRSEYRYRSMFEHSPLPMWTFDRQTLQFISINDAAIGHYGYRRDEFLAMTLADIVHADNGSLREDVQRVFEGAILRQHRKKDGTIISVEIQANDVLVDGRDARLALLNDVTERERAQDALRKSEDQLRQAQKLDAIGRLAGGVAHDFNNVLSVISGYAEFLEESLEPEDVRHADALEIQRATQRATAITRQLLMLSRHSMVTPCSIDLDKTVANFAPMLRRLVGDRVKLVLKSSQVPPVLGDTGQLEQVLMNLAVNARDAMPEGGRLTIELQEVDVDAEAAATKGGTPGRYSVIAVTDTGMGMSVETQQRMFDAFFTTKDASRGTGLGLSIVHGIITQAGGHISVYSELGNGTTFRIHLPVTEEHIEQRPREPVVDTKTLPAMTVLVVDDQNDVRTVAARTLQQAGCTVLEAASAEEARRICVTYEHTIEVILLDAILSDGRGDALAEQLRELRPAIQIVLMSGYPAGALDQHRGIPSDMLAKPFTPSELRNAMARVAGPGTQPARSFASDTVMRSRVLLVDDDDDLRRVLTRVLRRAEFEVVEVDSARKALSEIEAKKPFDVILSDVHMPEMSGLDLLRSVRRVDLDVPVIMMSGEPSVEAAATAVEHGAFRYLTKPFDNDAITKVVRHAARAYALARLRREALSVGGTHAGAVDRAGLGVQYGQALDGLFMVFQPIVEARTNVPFGLEALMRSTELSLPNPQAVLEAATTLGRLSPLGRRIRKLSASAFATRSDDLALFVNLHPDDLFDVDLIDEAAPLTQIAHRVILEVTERASLSMTSDLTSRIARLRQLGFRLAVDDIGSGYSGLTSFTELNPEIVKLDMAIVRDVHVSALKQRTIRALCRLCHEGGCLVVGEGVETIEERECLTELGCDLLQGYLIARPAREITV